MIDENKTVTQLIEDIAAQICDTRCRYPHEWDEEKEGIPLCDSDVCRNCPLGKL